MNTNSTLQNAILNFAFTGVMQPHKPAEDERVKSPETKQPLLRKWMRRDTSH